MRHTTTRGAQSRPMSLYSALPSPSGSQMQSTGYQLLFQQGSSLYPAAVFLQGYMEQIFYDVCGYKK